MKKRLKIVTIMLIFIFFIGCDNKRTITSRYYLDAIDVIDNTCLYYEFDDKNAVGVVQPTVFAVGYNNKYIFVKQHPNNNKKITNYFIVPIYRDNTNWPEKGVIGPLTLEQFKQKEEELRIGSNIKFTIEIEGLK